MYVYVLAFPRQNVNIQKKYHARRRREETHVYEQISSLGYAPDRAAAADLHFIAN